MSERPGRTALRLLALSEIVGNKRLGQTAQRLAVDSRETISCAQQQSSPLSDFRTPKTEGISGSDECLRKTSPCFAAAMLP